MSKKKKKKDKDLDLDLDFKFSKSWKQIFRNWDGKTRKRYKDMPLRFTDEKTGKTVINKKTKSLRPFDVFLLEQFPDTYTITKSRTQEEFMKSASRIMEKENKKYEERERQADIELWKTIDRNSKKGKSKYKMSKQEKKIMEFFNKRNGIDPKKMKKESKKEREKFNKLSLNDLYISLEVKEAEEFLEFIKNKKRYGGFGYGFTKKGKPANPNKKLMKRLTKNKDSQQILNVFKDTLVDEIEARLIYDPFSTTNHPVIDYSLSNIRKDASKKEKEFVKKKNNLDIRRLNI